MKRRTVIIVCVAAWVAVATSLFSQENPAPAAGATGAPAIQETQKTTNAVADAGTNEVPVVEIRDPFSPVGYKKAKPVAVAVQEEIKHVQKIQQTKESVVWPAIKFKGSTGGARHAFASIDSDGTIEGTKVVSAGDTIRIRKDGWLYRLRVVEVTEQGLKIQKLDATPPGPDSTPIDFTK